MFFYKNILVSFRHSTNPHAISLFREAVRSIYLFTTVFREAVSYNQIVNQNHQNPYLIASGIPPIQTVQKTFSAGEKISCTPRNREASFADAITAENRGWIVDDKLGITVDCGEILDSLNIFSWVFVHKIQSYNNVYTLHFNKITTTNILKFHKVLFSQTLWCRTGEPNPRPYDCKPTSQYTIKLFLLTNHAQIDQFMRQFYIVACHFDGEQNTSRCADFRRAKNK